MVGSAWGGAKASLLAPRCTGQGSRVLSPALCRPSSSELLLRHHCLTNTGLMRNCYFIIISIVFKMKDQIRCSHSAQGHFWRVSTRAVVLLAGCALQAANAYPGARHHARGRRLQQEGPLAVRVQRRQVRAALVPTTATALAVAPSLCAWIRCSARRGTPARPWTRTSPSAPPPPPPSPPPAFKFQIWPSC